MNSEERVLLLVEGRGNLRIKKRQSKSVVLVKGKMSCVWKLCYCHRGLGDGSRCGYFNTWYFISVILAREYLEVHFHELLLCVEKQKLEDSPIKHTLAFCLLRTNSLFTQMFPALNCNKSVNTLVSFLRGVSVIFSFTFLLLSDLQRCNLHHRLPKLYYLARINFRLSSPFLLSPCRLSVSQARNSVLFCAPI